MEAKCACNLFHRSCRNASSERQIAIRRCGDRLGEGPEVLARYIRRSDLTLAAREGAERVFLPLDVSLPIRTKLQMGEHGHSSGGLVSRPRAHENIAAFSPCEIFGSRSAVAPNRMIFPVQSARRR